MYENELKELTTFLESFGVSCSYKYGSTQEYGLTLTAPSSAYKAAIVNTLSDILKIDLPELCIKDSFKSNIYIFPQHTPNLISLSNDESKLNRFITGFKAEMLKASIDRANLILNQYRSREGYPQVVEQKKEAINFLFSTLKLKQSRITQSDIVEFEKKFELLRNEIKEEATKSPKPEL